MPPRGLSVAFGSTPKLGTYPWPGVRYPWAFGVLTLFDIGGMPSPPQAVNLRAGVVVAMGAPMLKSGARLQ